MQDDLAPSEHPVLLHIGVFADMYVMLDMYSDEQSYACCVPRAWTTGSAMQVVRQSWVSEGMADGLGTTFFLDGAHTPESMATCAEWFCEASQTQLEFGLPAGQQALAPHRILLFNCMKVTITQ